jgi:hypothetical protein
MHYPEYGCLATNVVYEAATEEKQDFLLLKIRQGNNENSKNPCL